MEGRRNALTAVSKLALLGRVVCGIAMGHRQCPKLAVAGRDTAAAMAFSQAQGAKSPL